MSSSDHDDDSYISIFVLSRKEQRLLVLACGRIMSVDQ